MGSNTNGGLRPATRICLMYLVQMLGKGRAGEGLVLPKPILVVLRIILGRDGVAIHRSHRAFRSNQGSNLTGLSPKTRAPSLSKGQAQGLPIRGKAKVLC